MFTLILLAGISPATAGTMQSEWNDNRFVNLADLVSEQGGVRISNCHLEFSNLGNLEAVPKCYVLNKSGKPALVRVEVIALDNAGKQVLSATIATPFPLPDMNGIEIRQDFPISKDDIGKIYSGRLRFWTQTAD